MFEKLRSAFGALSRLATQVSISEKEIDASISDLEMSLIESDVASEVVESITSNLKNHLLDTKIPRSEDKQNFIASQLKDSIRSLFALTPKVDLIAQIRSKLQRNVSSEFEPFVVLFLGINGT